VDCTKFLGSRLNIVLSKEKLDSVEVWHFAGLKFRVFKVTINVDLKCTGLHKLGLNHGAQEEHHQAELQLVVLNVVIKIL